MNKIPFKRTHIFLSDNCMLQVFFLHPLDKAPPRKELDVRQMDTEVVMCYCILGGSAQTSAI